MLWEGTWACRVCCINCLFSFKQHNNDSLFHALCLTRVCMCLSVCPLVTLCSDTTCHWCHSRVGGESGSNPSGQWSEETRHLCQWGMGNVSVSVEDVVCINYVNVFDGVCVWEREREREQWRRYESVGYVFIWLFFPSHFLSSLVVQLVISRGCHSWKLFGSFSFGVVLLTLPIFTSAWCHRYIYIHPFMLHMHLSVSSLLMLHKLYHALLCIFFFFRTIVICGYITTPLHAVCVQEVA